MRNSASSRQESCISEDAVRRFGVTSNEQVKILRIITRLNIGGPAGHVVSLQIGLDPHRFKSLLVVGRESPGEGSLVESACARGASLDIVPEMSAQAGVGLRDLKALFKLHRLMQRERPHIVHTHTAKSGFLGRIAARLAGVPIVVHTFHGHILNGYFGPARSVLLRRMEWMLARLSDRLVAVSERVRQELVAYGIAPLSKIVVIPVGLDLGPFIEMQRRRGEFRRELGLAGGDQLIGIIGRLFPIKNHKLFLEAAARIAAAKSSSRFVIVGDGPLRPQLERQAGELGLGDRVIFTGWRLDLPPVYSDLDVLVVSSINEGTPVVAIEAMAAGCPVVATRVGGIPDVLQDGETGLTIPSGDARALAGAVVRLLEDPQLALTISRNAKITAVERFAASRLISDIERLYEQLLAEKGLDGQVESSPSPGNAP